MRNMMIVALFALALSAAPAFARPVEQSETVSVAGLNLSQPAGADLALRRIHAAAKRVCGERTGVVALVERRAIRACVREATATAVMHTHNTGLELAFQRRFGESAPVVLLAGR